jgi:sec-independent protein translocase protein TatA
MGLENPVHLIFIGIVALLVLGPRRLPELARALGHGLREFREAMSLESRDAQEPVVQAPAPEPREAQAPAPREAPAPAPREAPASAPREAPTAAAEPMPLDGAGGPEVTRAAAPVDPAQPVRSGDAPDRGPL